MAAVANPLTAAGPQGCGVEDAFSLKNQLATLHPKSFAWAMACCRYDRVEAEEVLQTSYLKILSGRARSRPQAFQSIAITLPSCWALRVCK